MNGIEAYSNTRNPLDGINIKNCYGKYPLVNEGNVNCYLKINIYPNYFKSKKLT